MWISNFCQNKSEQQHQFLAKGVHKMLENVSKACRIAIGDQWGDQQSTSWHHGQLLVTNNIQIYKSDVLGLNIITITTSPHSAAYLHTTSALQCSWSQKLPGYKGGLQECKKCLHKSSPVRVPPVYADSYVRWSLFSRYFSMTRTV